MAALKKVLINKDRAQKGISFAKVFLMALNLLSRTSFSHLSSAYVDVEDAADDADGED